MNKKINIEDLFVVCPTIDYIESTYSWEQYGYPGGECHAILVNPKKILKIRTHKEGKDIYYDALTGIQIIPSAHLYSYQKTNFSMREDETYPSYKMPRMIPLAWRLPKNIITDKFGYLVPFKEYIKDVLGTEIEYASLTKARILLLLLLTNISCDRPFKLSNNPEQAAKQIDEKVLRKKI